MKKLFIYILFVFVSLAGFTQIRIEIKNNDTTNSELLFNSEERIIFSNSVGEIFISEYNTKDGTYAKLSIPGYYPDMNIGNPELPVMAKLLEIPLDSDIEINILEIEENMVELEPYGIYFPIYPNQPSLSKAEDPETVDFIKNKKIYSDKEYYSTEPVHLVKLGKMRGVQMAQLIVNPFSYDIESNTLNVITNIKVEIIFKNANRQKTIKLKADKYSPVFEQAYRKLWNYRSADETKDVISKHPVKYIIISDRMFEEVLQPFIKWKSQKGFNVQTYYTDEIGQTSTELKTLMETLYNEGTNEDPAPSYLLLVGDIQQVPPFYRKVGTSGYVTDLYYCTFDGEDDYIPDMYYGRFSANNVEELKPQIEKTLIYEQYAFPAPDYLDEALLVVGTDHTYSEVYCNGQMNYANEYYLNSEHGINANKFLYPDAESKISEIKDVINSGVGFVNYSAHCSSSGWVKPYFRVADVRNLTNTDLFFFSVSNCCLSSKFNETECFGESLLRADMKGAVAHIGGAENTYWTEDYYWTVGTTGNINANPTYEETGTAIYDHLFHENGEEPYTTAGQMVYIGNMSVEASTSPRKNYYWEIYNVLGDPSLMPYMGVPSNIKNVTIPSSINHGMTFLSVYAEHDTYVAVSTDGKLLDAGLTDSDGWVQLKFDVLSTGTILDVVMTKQFRKPLFGKILIEENEVENDVMIKSINTPKNIHKSALPFSPSFEIVNIGLNKLEAVKLGYSLNNGGMIEMNWEGSLETYETANVFFPEISIEDGIYSFKANASLPNGVEDGNPDNNEMISKIIIYSGNVSLEEVLIPGSVVCSTNEFIPEIVIKNTDIVPLTSLTCMYECGNVKGELLWTGNVYPGAIQNITFPINSFPEGENTIVFSISKPNGGMFYDGSEKIKMIKKFNLNSAGHQFRLDFLTDIYGGENMWTLIDLETNDVLRSDGPFTQGKSETYSYFWCLDRGCYEFTIYDLASDGMGGSPAFDIPPGEITITDINENNIILKLIGNDSEFKDHYSFKFCYEDVNCPDDMNIYVEDAPFILTGAIPTGGVFSGAGVHEGYFYPSEVGRGNHLITYTYSDYGDVKECSFYINTYFVDVPVDEADEKINIYPNPVRDILTLKVTDVSGNVDVELFNVMGQKVNSISSKDELIYIDLSGFKEGAYFVRVINKEEIITKKIILQR